jgi:hypothetical protein
LIVCVGSTFGWRHTSPLELAGSMTRAGARVEAIVTGPLRPVRTFMLTDLAEARAARRTAQRGIASFHPRAIVYCSMTASLLWPRPGAIWFDSVAAENRPGRHGLWQRVVERRRIREAPLLIGMSADALSPLRIRSLDAVVPVPVEPSAPARAARDITAVTYAGDPAKRRLSLVLDAWEAARRPGEELMVAGTDSLPGGRDGVSVAGRMAREDYGTAALEALADGCRLVTTEAAGPYPALSLARTLDPRLVGDDLARALRVALDDPVPDYASRAEALLAPFRRGAIDEVVKRDVLPSLLPGFVPS